MAGVPQKTYPRVLSIQWSCSAGHVEQRRKAKWQGGPQGGGLGQGQGLGQGCQHLFKLVPPSSASETASLSWIFSLRVCHGRETGKGQSGHSVGAGPSALESPPVEQEYCQH